MSFGCGVGDILAISKLAWDVYNSYKDAPNDFRNISGEIKSLHIIVNSDNLKAIFQDPKLALEEREGLREILQGCTNVLEDLDKLLIKYKSLGSPQGSRSRAIDRAKWGQEGIAEQRARLISNTILLNTFVTNQIQTMLRKGLRRRNSTSSLHSIASFAGGVDSKETWKQLCRDLHKAGVTADTIRERKDQIVGLFQGSGLPVEDLKPQTRSSITPERSIDPSKGVNTDRQKRNQSPEIDQTPLKAYTGPLLIAAVGSGNIDVARLRLTMAADIEDKDAVGTALVWAAAKGHRRTVQLLLEQGANIEATGYGATALYVAAQGEHLEVVKLLIEKGANIEAAVRGATALFMAAHHGRLEVVKLLLEKGANIEAATGTGKTALYIAACNGHMEVAKLLLENGASKEAAISTGETALSSAAFSGHLEVVKLLLDKGSNIEGAGHGVTALYAAAERGHLGVVKLLVEKRANIEATTVRGATALFIAAHNGRLEVVELLLEKGANIEAATGTGKTALLIAAKEGHLGVVKLLLEKGASREKRTIDGETAVGAAAGGGHKKIVKLLE